MRESPMSAGPPYAQGPAVSNWFNRPKAGPDLMDLYIEPDIISEIRKGRLRWLGHVERMPEERTVKKEFKNIPEGKRTIGNSR